MAKLVPIFIALLFVASPVWGGALKVYTENTGGAYFKDGHFESSGVEVVREIIKRTEGGEYIEVVPWMRGYDALLHKPNVVLFPTTLTEERKSLFHWVGPTLRVQWVLYAAKGRGSKFDSLEKAREAQAIGVYLGDAKGEYLKNLGFENLVSAPDNVTNYRKLAHHRVDLVVSTSLRHDEIAEHAGVRPDDLEPALVVREMDLYIAFSRQTSPRIVKRWRKAFESMRNDGTFAEIYKKWFPHEVAPMEPLVDVE